MGEFIKIGSVKDIPTGQCKEIKIHDEDIGVFNVDGRFCAIDNRCPHMGAALSQGHVKDGVVMCPLHMWRFDVRNGKSLTAPGADLKTFEIKIEGEDILLRKE